MAYKIKIKDAIKRIGSKRDYYKYRDELKILPVSYENGNKLAPFHTESHFIIFERKFNELHTPKVKIVTDNPSLERTLRRIANDARL